MINRMEKIKSKGFKMTPANDRSPVDVDFSKIKVGIKSLEDAVYEIGNYKKVHPRYGDKAVVLKAIADTNLEDMRAISNFFFRTSGIYARLCRYMAFLYRYDWLITPYVNEGLGVVPDADTDLSRNNKDKILTNFFRALKYLDDFEVKRFFGDVALKVIRNGCYYGYIIANGSSNVQIQELPVKYCRSRFTVNNRAAIEFNMKYFDDAFKDEIQRQKILKLFPEEFRKGYKAFKKGRLLPDFPGDSSGWYLLDVGSTVKFNMNGEDFPAFISVIPAIIDLDEAQELDRKKMAQKLLKIIIQKMPIDKNGDLVFDVDEAQALHNNAVQMLGKAIGIDVLTTFADVDVADMADKNTTTTVDDLGKVERTVYNEAGVSQMQFNSTGNIALNNSILNDEASMYNLLEQFESFLNYLLTPFNRSPKRCYYRAQILTTTIYNYKEMAKLYKEQTQMGYSKMLPQIALGQSQSSILANAYYENDLLQLIKVFVPPITSNVMNAEALGMITGKTESLGGKGRSDNADAAPTEEKQAGRPEKDDSEKSEKTIQNRESM